MEEDQEEYWDILQEDYQQEQYAIQPVYKRNHTPNSLLINYNLKVSGVVSRFVQDTEYKDKVSLSVLVGNLMCCLKKDRSLVYHRKKSIRIQSRKKLSVYKMIKAVDFLIENGYATGSVGSGSVDIEKRVSSYIKATDKFKEMWTDKVTEDSHINYLKDMNVIELRDEDKQPKKFTADYCITYMSEVVRDLNIMNERHTVRNGAGEVMTNIYCRVFNDTFEQGGRYYRADILALQHSKGRGGRHHVTIDGCNVAEVDYSNLHFRISAEMNRLNSHDLPLDVYSGMLEDENNLVDRQVVKLAVNMMFNSDGKDKARQAIQGHINKMSVEDKEVFSLGSATNVMDLIYKCYPEFTNVLCRSGGYGLMLQNEDSSLATSIIEVFLAHDKPILVVHDSFVVRVEDMNLLCDSMGEVFRARYDTDVPVPVNLSWKEADGEIIKCNINV